MDVQKILKRPFIKKLLEVGLVKALSIPLALAISVILARLLGANDFGQYSFAMALVPLLALPVSGGVTALLTREVAANKHVGNWPLYKGVMLSAYQWVILVSTVLVVVYLCLAMAGWIPSEEKWGLLPYVILLVPLVGLNAVRDGAFRGLKEPFWAILPSQVLQPLIVLMGVTILLFAGALEKEHVMLSQAAALLIIFLFSTAILKRKQPSVLGGVHAFFKRKQWLAALVPFSLINIVSVLNSNVGIVLLGVMGENESVAAMRVADKGAQLVNLPLVLIGLVMAPYVVAAWSNSDKASLQRLATRSSQGALLLSFPCALAFIFYGEELVNLVFGLEYGAISYAPLVILTIGQLFNVFFGQVGLFLSMTGHEKITLIGQAASLLINILLCIALIPSYGSVGAAIGVSVGLFVWNVLLFYLLYKYLGVKSWVFGRM